MTPRPAEHGSASVAALTLLILLAAVSAGTLLVLQAALSYEKRSVTSDELKQSLEKEAQTVVQALARNPKPTADSPFDPVWDVVNRPATADTTITLTDVSSALNPNWVQKNLFQKTRLAELLRPGRTADELQQRREDKGFSTDIQAAYGDLFREGVLDKYFTGYGYANLNVTDEFALRGLYRIRTGDDARANEFHTRVQNLLMSRRVLKPEELRTFLGVVFDRVYPLICVEPMLNVHFADPLVLSELLAHPDLKVPRPAESLQQILLRRESAELTAEELGRIIGVERDNRIFQYLGVITWFWRISVTRGASRLQMVAARLPAAQGAHPRYLVIEERYER
jgi:hypothetical protein